MAVSQSTLNRRICEFRLQQWPAPSVSASIFYIHTNDNKTYKISNTKIC